MPTEQNNWKETLNKNSDLPDHWDAEEGWEKIEARLFPDNVKERSDATAKIKILAYYQIFGGFVGLGLLIYLLSILGSYHYIILVMVSAGVILFSYSVFCGTILFRDPVRGLRHSLVNQVLQLLHFSIGGYAFQYISGIHISLTLDLSNLNNLVFTFGVSACRITFNQDVGLSTVSIDFIALFLVIFIDKLRTRIKNATVLNELDTIGRRAG